MKKKIGELVAGFPTTLYLVRLLTANAFYMLDYGQNSGGMGRILAQVDQDPPNLYVGKPQIRIDLEET